MIERATIETRPTLRLRSVDSRMPRCSASHDIGAARSLHLFSLFVLARDLSQEQQLRFVGERCAADPKLGDELWNLLQDHRRTAQVEAREGMLLAGRYTLEAQLGSGSAGAVWCAYDNKLARKAALKIFHLGSCDTGGLNRALREARAASHIVSEHVVRVRDAAWCGRTGAYIDMELCAEFVDGEWVIGTSMARTRPRNLSEIVRWVMQAARGVQAAHEQGVFHRDLKPDNVVIKPAVRTALVTDFGLALQALRSAEPDACTDADRNRHWPAGDAPRIYAGTPCYMAPEQAEGLPYDLNPNVPDDHDRLTRIDVYGLGAILYELLAGRPPYVPRDAAMDPMADVLSQVRATLPAPLRGSTRVWRSARRVPARLDRIVRKAMARDPHQRYPSCAALAADLERFLAHQPTSLDNGRHMACAALWTARRWKAVVPVMLLMLAACMLGYTALLGAENDRLRARVHDTALQLQAAFAEQRGLRAEHAAGAAALASEAARSRAAVHRERVEGLELELAKVRRTRVVPRADVDAEWTGRTDAWIGALSPPDWMSRLAPADALATRPKIPRPTAPEPIAITALRPASSPAQSRHGALLGDASSPSTERFLRRARHGPFRLWRVDRSDRTIGYCLVHRSNDRVDDCLFGHALSPGAASALSALHERSGDESVWQVDEQGGVVGVCSRRKGIASHIRKRGCYRPSGAASLAAIAVR